MVFSDENLPRPKTGLFVWLGKLAKRLLCPEPFQMRRMILTGFHDFTDSRRPFGAALDVRSRVANILDHLIGEALQHGAERVLEALRIRILINSIRGEQG